MRRGWVAFAASVLVLAASAFAEKEDRPDQARKLSGEARPFVQTSNDTDLSLEERKAPRREAYTRLKQARGLYDQYLDANPKMEEKLDQEYVELNVLIYGLRKDSA